MNYDNAWKRMSLASDNFELAEAQIVANYNLWLDEDSGITDNCREGDLMFIWERSQRKYSVYRLQIQKGKKVFKRVPRNLWDERIQAEISLKILERARHT